MGETQNLSDLPKETAWKWRFYQHPDDPEGGAQKRYQWCINKDAFEAIKNGGYKTAEVLIVLVDKEGYETRHIVHLSDMQAFVPIRKPGAYKVYAKVILRSKDNAYKMFRAEYLILSGKRYHYCVFDRDAEKQSGKKEIALHVCGYDNLVGFELIETSTHVSAESFGAPPPAWLMWWVDFLHSEKTSDTCHFRKRLPYAIFGKPFVALGLVALCVAAWMALLAISVCIVLWTGNRGMNWGWFLKPSLDDSPFEVLSKYSAITHGRNERPRAAWRMRTFLIPWVQVLLVGETYLFAWWIHWAEYATEFDSVWLHRLVPKYTMRH